MQALSSRPYNAPLSIHFGNEQEVNQRPPNQEPPENPPENEAPQLDEPNAFIRGLKVIRNGIFGLLGLSGALIGGDQVFLDGKILDKFLNTPQVSAPEKPNEPLAIKYAVDNTKGIHIYINGDEISIEEDGEEISNISNSNNHGNIDFKAVLLALEKYDESFRRSRDATTKSQFDRFTAQPAPTIRPVVTAGSLIQVPQGHPSLVIQDVVIEPRDQILVQDPRTFIVQRHNGGRHQINNMAAFAFGTFLQSMFFNRNFYGHRGPIHFHHGHHGHW